MERMKKKKETNCVSKLSRWSWLQPRHIINWSKNNMLLVHDSWTRHIKALSQFRLFMPTTKIIVRWRQELLEINTMRLLYIFNDWGWTLHFFSKTSAYFWKLFDIHPYISLEKQVRVMKEWSPIYLSTKCLNCESERQSSGHWKCPNSFLVFISNFIGNIQSHERCMFVFFWNAKGQIVWYTARGQ